MQPSFWLALPLTNSVPVLLQAFVRFNCCDDLHMMPAEPNSHVRRSHRKSRNGCKDCKLRHTKCDENRPSCVNCTTAGRRCSYLDFHVRHPRLPDNAHQTVSYSETQTPSASVVTPTASTTSPAESTGGSNEVITDCAFMQSPGSFDLSHLVLLHHLENKVLKQPHTIFLPDEQGQGLSYEAIFKSAASAPYLMNELLAISALHLSTLQSGSTEKAHYLHQAAELQTRALTLFNAAKPEVRDGNSVAMLVFSSLLGIHALFDAVASHRDFNDFLSKFTHYLNLHRGVRAIAHQGWPALRESEIKHVVDTIEHSDRQAQQLVDTPYECDRLVSLLESSRDKLGPVQFRVCCEALQTLRWVFGQYHALPKPYPTHIILAWPITISADFTELLDQRQPIALVLLAHWAVLLHADRDFWIFGNTGRFLIESLSAYLGTYWDDWLAIPKDALKIP